MELFLHLLAAAVQGSPALWHPEDFRRHGYEVPPNRVCPDTAVFDVWVETPGTGWYEMCERGGFPGYDGEHAAFALELDSCYLSWDESCDSLAARLQAE